MSLYTTPRRARLDDANQLFKRRLFKNRSWAAVNSASSSEVTDFALRDQPAVADFTIGQTLSNILHKEFDLVDTKESLTFAPFGVAEIVAV
jgi:hypothetical protein